MAKQAAVPEKKKGAGKTAQAKTGTKKRVSKGESLVCGVCGLSVVVEEVGGVAVSEENVLLCCGKPMKSKAAKAAKTTKAVKTNKAATTNKL